MLALAFLDEIFIFYVFMAGLTVEPGSKHRRLGKRERKGGIWPFGLFRRLGDEETNGVSRDLGEVRVYDDLRVASGLLRLDLNGQQEQLQFDEAEPSKE